MTRAPVLRHVPFEGAGAIGGWLRQRRFSVGECRLWEGETLPCRPPHWLVLMGGPMNIHDERQHPWLVREKVFIRECIAAGTTLVGVCLGAQLLANVLGAEVRRGEPEIGWFPVRPTGGHPLARHFMDEPAVLHWHGDRFDIPEGADHLLTSTACPSQAFVYGDRILGLQFHLEADEAGVDALSRECAEELDPSRSWIQPRAALLKGIRQYGPDCRTRLYALLDDFSAQRQGG